MDIRLAVKKDLWTIIGLMYESWPEWWKDNKENGLKHVTSRIEKNNVWVFIECGLIRGYQIATISWNKIHLDDIYICPSERKKGYATQLYLTLEKWALSKKLKEIVSDCHTNNFASISMHCKWGFETNGFLKNCWDSEDYICFRKKLE